VRAATKPTRHNEPPIGAEPARSATPGTLLVLPATSPYEWELLREHVVASARQRGTLRLRIEGLDCTVQRERDPARRCGGCGRGFQQVSFRVAARDVCLGCARRWVSGETRDADAFEEDCRADGGSWTESRPGW
jgi:hypothetical protein